MMYFYVSVYVYVCKQMYFYIQSYSVSTTLDKTVEENEHLQEKLVALHEQNASLTSQNHHLKDRVETMNFELMQSKTKVCIFCIFIKEKHKPQDTQ